MLLFALFFTLDESVGCYHDKGIIDSKGIFPRYKDLRDLIIWQDMPTSFSEIVQICYELARDQGCTVRSNIALMSYLELTHF